MSRTVCSVCYLFLAISFCAPAFGQNAPNPSEAEVKAMSDKLVEKFQLFSQIKKESDQNTIDMYNAAFSKKGFGEYLKHIEAINIREGEINLKSLMFLGIDKEVVKQRSKLGDLYSKAGNVEKACEHWKEGRELALKLELSATAEEISSKLTPTCQNKTP